MLMTMVSIHLLIFLIHMALNNFILDIHSYLPQDVLEWVNQTLADNNLCIPNACSNDLEQIYILLVSKIKAHNEYGNQHATLRLLPKPVGAYNWTSTPNISTKCVLYDIELSDMQDEEWVDVKEFCRDELMKEEVYT